MYVCMYVCIHVCMYYLTAGLMPSTLLVPEKQSKLGKKRRADALMCSHICVNAYVYLYSYLCTNYSMHHGHGHGHGLFILATYHQLAGGECMCAYNHVHM